MAARRALPVPRSGGADRLRRRLLRDRVPRALSRLPDARLRHRRRLADRRDRDSSGLADRRRARRRRIADRPVLPLRHAGRAAAGRRRRHGVGRVPVGTDGLAGGSRRGLRQRRVDRCRRLGRTRGSRHPFGREPRRLRRRAARPVAIPDGHPARLRRRGGDLGFVQRADRRRVLRARSGDRPLRAERLRADRHRIGHRGDHRADPFRRFSGLHHPGPRDRLVPRVPGLPPARCRERAGGDRLSPQRRAHAGRGREDSRRRSGPSRPRAASSWG